ncbi:MAG: dTDP-4-dehydrorhamnose reductase [Sulfurimonas sp.]|nr:dTDP-4-dehydrorhamnose reductase [Sulfurimonas sp.]
MLNILVTGSNGQLGSELRELVARGTAKACTSEKALSDVLASAAPSDVEKAQGTAQSGERHGLAFLKACTSEEHISDVLASAAPKDNFFFTDREALDITDKNEVAAFIEKNKINTIINCAAYTAVDKAESDAINADAINHLAVKYLAEISKKKNIQLIHISTDYVFDGKNYKPYNEEDTTNPQGVYGATKLAGENAIIELNPINAIIIRTSWVYSSFGANFVKTMLRLGKEKESLGVIFDQVGTPTYARDLARAILDILPKIGTAKAYTSEELERGTAKEQISDVLALAAPKDVQIYNYSNEGVLSWYDFAKEIMRMAKLECAINPIETKEYPTPATRPHYSLLNKSKIKKEFNLTIPYWKDSLDECLRIMGERR